MESAYDSTSIRRVIKFIIITRHKEKVSAEERSESLVKGKTVGWEDRSASKEKKKKAIWTYQETNSEQNEEITWKEPKIEDKYKTDGA